MLRTALLLALMTALLLVVGRTLAGSGGMIVALVVAAAMNLGAWWFSDSLVLSMTGAKEVTEAEAPGFVALVRDLALRNGMPMPRTFIVDDPQPNAFATGRSPERAAVAATTGLLDRLTPDEVVGVMAHELAHVRNRDTLTMSVAATIGGAVGMLANVFSLFGGDRENKSPIAGIVAILLAPLVAVLIQTAISRSREFVADAEGARMCGDPEKLASALERLEDYGARIPSSFIDDAPAAAHLCIANPFSGRTLSALFSTHPDMGERIRRLRAIRPA